MLGVVETIGAPIPESIPDLADYDDPMASAMTPILGAYWNEEGKDTAARLGLDPDEWRVTDPHLKEKIETASFQFCKATNETTTMELKDALAALRDELIQGVVEEGESVSQLTKRVQAVFENAEKWRARRIAQTEASRAVHTARLESASRSDVVLGKQWVLSSDACPLCQTIARRAGVVPMGSAFAVIGDHPYYSSIQTPPGHPGCQCTWTEVIDLSEELGEPLPAFQETLIQPVPEDEDKPQESDQ